ncbi:MAG: AAA family ATPase, partial [Enhygromyxa sp.]
MEGSDTEGVVDHDPEQRHRDVAPTQIGRFAVLGKLGQGGMGVVFLGHDGELERKVAIKLLRSNAARTIGVRRLIREAQGLARLSHPNVIQVHEIGEHQGSMFVAMEYVEGSTLRDWLDAERQPWRRALEVLRQAGRGLEAAHAAGLVHRDFKPGNVMVGDDGRARVLDFGLARASNSTSEEPRSQATPPPAKGLAETFGDSGVFEGLSALTRSGAVLGTPAYMAPEQIQGHPCDALSDQFSFCVTAYEALFGRRPFAGETFVELAAQVASSTIEPIPADSPVPLRLQEAVLRGLSLDPTRRWPSMAALLDELDDLITKADLQAYLEQMREAGAGELLEPEPAARFRVSERLYGREAELERLREAFARTCAEPPRSQLVLVSGPAGIGKSALIERLRPTVEERGIMCAGKFDPQRATPLTGITDALDDLIAQLERLEPSSQLRLRRAIGEAVGRNARLLCELLPAAARLLDDPELLGEAARAPRRGAGGAWLASDLKPDPRQNPIERFATASASPERLNRLHLALGRLASTVAACKGPLVLFLDDLQWIDDASLALLQHLLSSPAEQALLVVGSYRSSELGPDHPLHEAVDRLEAGGAEVLRVALEALSLTDTEA